MKTEIINNQTEHKIFGYIPFSKKNLLIVIFGWYLNTNLIFLVFTDLLTESPFQRKNFLMFVMWLFGTVGFFKMIKKTYNIKLSVELK